MASLFRSLITLLVVSFFPTPAFAQPSVVGTWDSPVQLNVDGVHAAVLPSGKVLYLPHRDTGGGVTTSVVFDPDNPAGANYVAVPQNYFCGGHSFLSDGRLLFVGGETVDLDKVGYFAFGTETWTEVTDLNRPRWYPSAIQFGDGSVWAFGGQSEAADPDQNDDTIERYDPVADTWTMVGGEDIPGRHVEAYNRIHLMPDGKVFQSGHLPDSYMYDPVAKTWTFVA
ncbi:MAG: hypothetical protein MJE66_15045, partial [Proteobacteria bacterium]|nr:hypothetical protein [Pseudomonadota bacterium]